MWQTIGAVLMLILAVSAVGYSSAPRVDTVKDGGDTYKVQWLSRERFDGGPVKFGRIAADTENK